MKRQKVFLVLDNVCVEFAEARKYLDAGYHDGSKVLVTSRSVDVLKQLGIPESNCMEMPHLDQKGAMDVFLYYARILETSKNRLPGPADMEIVKRCVEECSFPREVGDGYFEEKTEYHPLALKVLGSGLGSLGNEVWRWEKRLEKLRSDKFNLSLEKKHRVFSILRLGYDALCTQEQRIFMDLALIWIPEWRSENFRSSLDWRWLCNIHRRTEHEMRNSVSVQS